MSAPWTGGGMLSCGAGQLRYAEIGQGPVLLLLPKLGGWLDEWRHVAPGLARTHRVIALDPPGHGGSRMAKLPPDIQSVPESAAAVAAALDSIGVETFAVAGVSHGGCIAIVLAALWPERVRRLALLSTSMAGRMERAALLNADGFRHDFTPQGLPLPRTAADLAKFGPMQPKVIAEMNESRAAAGPWLRPCERGAGRLGIADHLPRIAAPTLVINAAQGHYVQYEAVAQARIADVRLVTIADAGPFMHQEQPAATQAALLGFL